MSESVCGEWCRCCKALASHGLLCTNKSGHINPLNRTISTCALPEPLCPQGSASGALSCVSPVERNRNLYGGDFQSSSFSSTFAFSESSAFSFGVSEPPVFVWFSAFAASSVAAAATHAGAPAKAPMQRRVERDTSQGYCNARGLARATTPSKCRGAEVQSAGAEHV